MGADKQRFRVVVDILPREVLLRIFDSRGKRVEVERFTLADEEEPLDAASTARDVFDLLYQCAVTSVHGATE